MSLLDAVWVECRKALNTRTFALLALGLSAYTSCATALLAWSYSTSTTSGRPSLSMPEVTLALYGAVVPFGAVFVGMLGLLMVTAEDHHGTLSATLAAIPRRVTVVQAKAIAALLVGTLLAITAAAWSYLWVSGVTGAFGYSGAGSSDAVIAVLAAVPSLALWGPLGVGLGLIARRHLIAVILLIATTQLGEPLLRVALASGPATSLAPLLPGAASEAIVGSSIFTIGTDVELLAPALGALLLVGYVLAACLLGYLRIERQDIQ